jgi:hypothetical protein
MIAFHSLLEDGDVPLYSIEWRLPDGNEAPLCGHASLVGAHTIFSLHPEAKAVEFKTNARGIVRAEKYDNGEIGIELPLQAAGVPTAEEKARLAYSRFGRWVARRRGARGHYLARGRRRLLRLGPRSTWGTSRLTLRRW